jgi:hypothetical protein
MHGAQRAGAGREAMAGDNRAEHGAHLVGGEGRGQAPLHATAEREVFRRRRLVLEEALGAEARRVRKDPGIHVGECGGDEDAGADGQLVAIDFEGQHGALGHVGDDGVQAQGLVDDGAEVRQAGECLAIVDVDGGELVLQAGVDGGLAKDGVYGPGHGAGGGFMAGDIAPDETVVGYDRHRHRLRH